MFDALVTSCVDEYGADREVWSRCLLLLKPGASVLVHVSDSGPRTALALRRAGYERRDTLFFNTGEMCSLVLFFRKPFEESSAVRQVLATGTGAINVNACRTKGIVPAPTRTRTYRRFDNKYHDKDAKGNGPVLAEPPEQYDGRWPTNYLFRHSLHCRKVGTISYREFQHDQYECKLPCQVPIVEQQSAACGVVGSKTDEGHVDDGAAGRFYVKLHNDAELRVWLLLLATPPCGKVLDPLG